MKGTSALECQQRIEISSSFHKKILIGKDNFQLYFDFSIPWTPQRSWVNDSLPFSLFSEIFGMLRRLIDGHSSKFLIELLCLSLLMKDAIAKEILMPAFVKFDLRFVEKFNGQRKFQ